MGTRQKAMAQAKDILIRAGFDCALLLATFVLEDGDTYTEKQSFRNWHTQRGLLEHALVKDNETVRCMQRRNEEEEDEE